MGVSLQTARAKSSQPLKIDVRVSLLFKPEASIWRSGFLVKVHSFDMYVQSTYDVADILYFCVATRSQIIYLYFCVAIRSQIVYRI